LIFAVDVGSTICARPDPPAIQPPPEEPSLRGGFPSHNVRCEGAFWAKGAEKLAFFSRKRFDTRVALTAWLPVAVARKPATLATPMGEVPTMRARAVILTAAIIVAPLGAKAADLVVLWE